jgi:predicted Ser/Thr protein kinase
MASPSPELEKYVIEREVGRGTSGVVHRALDREANQVVALKILHRDSQADSRQQLAEAKLLTKIAHPAIVRILDHGVLPGDRPFVAMEWLDGEDLHQRQQRSPLALVPALRLIQRVAEGLAAAHAQGIVHRDIKPANIVLVTREGDTERYPKLVDFGAAMHVESAGTTDGAIIGTPAYMSPEQVRGEHTTKRSDIYSLGATLYELLAGHPPHQGPSYLATLARLATTRARRLLELDPETPPALDELVHQMLATEAEDRPATMQLVADELGRLIESITRGSIADSDSVPSHFGSSASRLLTTLVASGFPGKDERNRAAAHVKARGTEVVALGQDSLVAHFGARRALGNEAESALRIGRRLADSGASVGVATGRAFVPMVDMSKPAQAIGEVVDRATSLSRTARPGRVLADITTRELGRGLYEFTPGSGEYSDVGAAKNRSRLPTEARTPFVGRDTELSRVRTAYERCMKEPRAVVVSITGSPGIGKTRLRREAMTRLLRDSVIEHKIVQRSEPYGKKRALGVALDVLRMLLGLHKSSDENAARAAIRRTVENGLDPELRGRMPVFAKLLAQQQLSVEEDTRGLRDLVWLFMTQAVEHQLAAGPIVIVTEDLQWADPESVQWLDHLLARAAHLPLFLVVTARHEFWTEDTVCFASRDHVHIELHPMSNEGTRQLTAGASAGRLSSEAIESIVQQAGGSPLFAEELTRLAIVGAKVSQAPTIEAAIQVSLDALTEDQRDVLRHLSILGQAGWEDALSALGLIDGDSILRELSQIGVLVPHEPSRFVGMAEWQFKHGLVRDVVYQSMGEEHRQHLHELAGNWLEGMGEDPTVIARHYDLASAPERAAEFWASAAQRALGTNALRDALHMAERALAFAANRPQAFRRARLLDEAWSRLDARASDRETAVSALEDQVYDEASGTYAQGARARYDAARGQGFEVDERLGLARDAAQRLGLIDEEARCSAELAARLAFAGRFELAEREAAHLLTLAANKELRAAAVDAWQTLAIVHQSRGELSAALAARRNAATAAREAGLRERESVLTTNLGFALTTLGARVESRDLLFDGLRLAEAIGSVGARRHAHMLLLGWSASFGSDQQLDGILRDVRDDADAAAAGTWTAPARENLGVLFYRGLELLNNHGHQNKERARSLLRLSAEAYRNTKNRDLLPVALGLWARAELKCGDAAHSLELALSAATLLRSGAPSLLNESPVYLALHDAHARLAQPDHAKRAIEQAMAPLVRRVQGLAPTRYARPFLTALADNSALVSMAESYGVLPESIRRQLRDEP